MRTKSGKVGPNLAATFCPRTKPGSNILSCRTKYCCQIWSQTKYGCQIWSPGQNLGRTIFAVTAPAFFELLSCIFSLLLVDFLALYSLAFMPSYSLCSCFLNFLYPSTIRWKQFSNLFNLILTFILACILEFGCSLCCFVNWLLCCIFRTFFDSCKQAV